MPAHIEHRPPPGKSRTIRNSDKWNLPSDPLPRAAAENCRGKKLQKRLYPAKNPRPAACAQHATLPAHVQPVCLRLPAVLPPDHDPPGRAAGCFNRNRKSGRSTKPLGQQVGLGQKIRIQTRDGEGFVQGQASRLNVSLGRLRNQRKECGHRLGGGWICAGTRQQSCCCIRMMTCRTAGSTRHIFKPLKSSWTRRDFCRRRGGADFCPRRKSNFSPASGEFEATQPPVPITFEAARQKIFNELKNNHFELGKPAEMMGALLTP